jgi:predicted nucleotidyltransferase
MVRPTTERPDTLATILDKLRQNLPRLREDFAVSTLGVFGSYARADQGGASDVDVLVEFEEGTPMTLFKFVRLERVLGEILGVEVDLVMRDALRPEIGKRILAEVVNV